MPQPSFLFERPRATVSSQQARIQQVHREERLAKYEQVLLLLKQGWSRRAIADQVGIGLTTIQNWVLVGTQRMDHNLLDKLAKAHVGRSYPFMVTNAVAQAPQATTGRIDAHLPGLGLHLQIT